MNRTRFTETQIVKAIQEHEHGRDAKDLCRELGVSKAAFYKMVPMLCWHGSAGIKKA